MQQYGPPAAYRDRSEYQMCHPELQAKSWHFDKLERRSAAWLSAAHFDRRNKRVKQARGIVFCCTNGKGREEKESKRTSGDLSIVENEVKRKQLR